jgi:GT2 family glycosyltransferase
VAENIGTARGFNLAAKERNGRHVIKIDNDVVINTLGWVERLEAAADRCPEIGIFGIKRKDIEQHDKHPHPNFVSKVEMIPHEPGENWLFAEVTKDIMGTCVLYSNRLLDKVGYSFQWGVYGFEDNLLCVRSLAAGFQNCFVHPIDLDHIDTGANPYTETKRKQAHSAWGEYQKTAGAILRGEQGYYYDFY